MNTSYMAGKNVQVRHSFPSAQGTRFILFPQRSGDSVEVISPKRCRIRHLGSIGDFLRARNN